MQDAPRLLKDPIEQGNRLAMMTLPHVKPLTDYVAALRANFGEQYHIPDFDPCDGGVHARVLFLLEAPGPKAKASGFVFSNNPDPTAKNLWSLIHDAEIARADTLIWNIVPWYVGTGTKIRPVTPVDIREALPHPKTFLGLLPRLELIVLVGRKAQSAEPQIHALTTAEIWHTHHMSGLVFNRWPEKKRLIEKDFGKIGDFLNNSRRKETMI